MGVLGGPNRWTRETYFFCLTCDAHPLVCLSSFSQSSFSLELDQSCYEAVRSLFQVPPDPHTFFFSVAIQLAASSICSSRPPSRVP